MRTVLLMRHAKSDWKFPALDDHDRPLNKRGKRDAPRMAAFLKAEGLSPDMIVCSTATRALRTAEAIAAVCSCHHLKVDSNLYHASPEEWHEVLNALPPVGIVLGVGHNPGLEELLLDVTSEYHQLKTATVACLQFGEQGTRWDDGWDGTCTTYSPDDLKD